MTRTTIARIVEVFFRHWYLYLVPIVVMSGIGALAATSLTEDYTSSATVFVNRDSLVASRSDVASGVGSNNWLTPAEYSSQDLNGLLSTNSFLESVLEEMDTSWPDVPAPAGIDEVRGRIGAYPNGENLMVVSALDETPVTAQALAAATFDQYVAFQIDLDVADSEASEAYYTELVQGYQEDLTSIEQTIDELYEREGTTDRDDLSASAAIELDSLTEEESATQERLDSAEQRMEDAVVLRREAQTRVQQSFPVVDPPPVPTASNAGALDLVTTFLPYLLVGVLLSLGAPVVVALVGRRPLFASELASIGDNGVVAVLPRSKRTQPRTRRPPDVAPSPTPSPSSTDDGLAHDDDPWSERTGQARG